MEFGEWVKNVRDKQNLDVRSFAEITGVDSSTISRTENLQTQTTLYTVFRISEGMGVKLVDLIEILEGKRLSSLENNDFIGYASILTLQNIEEIISEFRSNKSRVIRLIASHLNKLLLETQSSRRKQLFIDYELIPYTEDDVNRFLYRSPLSYRTDMKYPLNIELDTISYIYEQKGALMSHDIETFMTRFRHSKVRTRLPIGLMPSMRVGTGSSLERIRFSDVLQFDIETEQNGKIIGMYWEACRFYANFSFTRLNQDYTSTPSTLYYRQPSLFEFPDEQFTIEREEWIMRLAVTITTIYRWYQFLKGNDFVFKMG